MNAEEFYQHTIREVIDRMRREFVEEGVSEDVLTRLEEHWKKKLLEIQEEEQILYQEYERRKQPQHYPPQFNPIFNQIPFQNQIDYMSQWPYQQPQMNHPLFQQPPMMPQQQFSHHKQSPFSKPPVKKEERKPEKVQKIKRQKTSQETEKVTKKAGSDDEDEDENEAFFGKAKDKASQQNSGKKTNGDNHILATTNHDSDESKNDDDSDESEEQEESSKSDDSEPEEEEPLNRINGQYTKVQRTKQKYKCQLSDVIFHIKGRDYIVKQIAADIEY